MGDGPDLLVMGTLSQDTRKHSPILEVPMVKLKTDKDLEVAIEALVALIQAREGSTPAGVLGTLRERAQRCLWDVGVLVELPRY